MFGVDHPVDGHGEVARGCTANADAVGAVVGAHSHEAKLGCSAEVVFERGLEPLGIVGDGLGESAGVVAVGRSGLVSSLVSMLVTVFRGRLAYVLLPLNIAGLRVGVGHLAAVGAIAGGSVEASVRFRSRRWRERVLEIGGLAMCKTRKAGVY